MKIFVDTGAWLALHDKQDQFHKQAIEAKTLLPQFLKNYLRKSAYHLSQKVT